ncbi:MAG: hypothetical protein HYY32_03360 [Chloroflexi bacterium]|nr:hypothetical protein [Chloroflexota bacterium]
MKVVESRAEVYFIALKSLTRAEREAVIDRIMDDAELQEDIADIALIRRRSGESTRDFRECLAGKKRRTRKA